MASKSRAQILAEIDTLIADNNSGMVTAEDLRTVLIDLAESYPNLIDEPKADAEHTHG
jgi:hypothetical protein